MRSNWDPEHWRAPHSERDTPGNETVASWSPILSCWEPGALLLSIEHLTLRCALGDVLGLLGRIPSLLWFLQPLAGLRHHMMRNTQSARETEAQGFKAQLPPSSAGMRYFCSGWSGLQKCFLPFFKRKIQLFNYSVFSLLCGEEQLCSDLCLSLAKDCYHPALQHQGSHGKLLKHNTALLKPWSMLRRKQVTFGTSITGVSYVPCKGGNSVGTGSYGCVYF